MSFFPSLVPLLPFSSEVIIDPHFCKMVDSYSQVDFTQQTSPLLTLK